MSVLLQFVPVVAAYWTDQPVIVTVVVPTL